MFIKSISNNTVDRFGRVVRVVTDHAKTLCNKLKNI